MTYLEMWGHVQKIDGPVIAGICDHCGGEMYDYEVRTCESCGSTVHSSCIIQCASCEHRGCKKCIPEDDETNEHLCGEDCKQDYLTEVKK